MGRRLLDYLFLYSNTVGSIRVKWATMHVIGNASVWALITHIGTMGDMNYIHSAYRNRAIYRNISYLLQVP